MPRDGSGNYTLPAGNPVVPSTIIATNWANTTLSDIAAALTASLSIDGSVTTAKIADDAVTPPKLAGLDVNGMVARISATEFEGRTVTGTANQITVTDGDGVAGNPTLSIPANPRIPGPEVRVVGDNTGATNVSALGFYESNGTVRKGIIGDTASGSSDITIATDVGDLVLAPTTNVVRPSPTSAVNLGSTSFTFQHVYAEGIAFPATQVASGDANTLDDYEEGTWTPAITFTTPGNLSISYSVATGTYVKIGKKVFVDLAITTATFTHTTASGSLNITGLPFSVSGAAGDGPFSFSGINKAAAYTNFVLRGSGTACNILASGSGVSFAQVIASDCPTGGTLDFRASYPYSV